MIHMYKQRKGKEMKRQLVVYLVSLAAFLGPFTQTIYTPILPEVREAFATSSFLINLTISIFTFFLAMMQIVYGPLTDRKGRRTVLLGGIVLDRAVHFLFLDRGPTIAFAACFGHRLVRLVFRPFAPSADDRTDERFSSEPLDSDRRVQLFPLYGHGVRTNDRQRAVCRWRVSSRLRNR